jgi:tetratricopeptide (TPR) repeat protein
MPAQKPLKRLTKNELFAKIRKADICEIAHKLKDCCKNDEKRADEARFAIFLGAGASVAAEIKTAGQMMEDFKEKILVRDCPSITAKKAQIKWLRENVLSKGKGNEYSKLFERFERTPKGRQNYVSKLLKDKEPTFGYAMLSSLIARGFINTILTTNFDDLAFISCTKFSGVRPVIYAYGILATEMKFSSPHPKILKMHGDYLYSALANTEIEMSRFNQDPNMKAQVASALNEYELIVFGYGGNDDSVMKILANYPPNKEFYWCYRNGEIPNEKVLKLLEAKNASLIQIEGFDDAMYEIYKIVDFDLDGVLAAYEDRRAEILRYIDEFSKKYPTKIVEDAIEKAAEETAGPSRSIKKTEPSAWFEYFIAARKARDVDNLGLAEKFFRKVIELKPDYAPAYNSLGVLLSTYPSRAGEAEVAYRMAIDLKPNNASALNNLGSLLVKTSPDPRLAIELIEKAIELDPRDLNKIFSLANAYKKIDDKKAVAANAEKARKLFHKNDWYFLALYYAILDNTEKCLVNLRKAIKSDPERRYFANLDQEFDLIRENPRFKEIVGG